MGRDKMDGSGVDGGPGSSGGGGGPGSSGGGGGGGGGGNEGHGDQFLCMHMYMYLPCVVFV